MKYMDTEKLRSDIMAGVDNALSKLGSKYEKLSEKTAETREKTQQYVRENPEKSMLIAAGVGALAGMIALLAVKKKMTRMSKEEK